MLCRFLSLRERLYSREWGGSSAESVRSLPLWGESLIKLCFYFDHSHSTATNFILLSDNSLSLDRELLCNFRASSSILDDKLF